MSSVPEGLAERLVQDDEAVLDEVLDSCGPAIRAHLGRKYAGLLRPGEIDDVVLAAVERTWRKRRELDLGGDKLSRWLFHVCEGLAVDLLRSQWVKQRTREREVSPEHLAGLPRRRRTPAEESGTVSPIPEVIELVREALGSLSEAQRRILTADANSPQAVAAAEDLADEFGISPSTVRTYRRRAYKRLRRELERYGVSAGDGHNK